MTNAVRQFAAAGVVFMVVAVAIAIAIARRGWRRQAEVKTATITRWIHDWREQVLDQDRQKFDVIVERYLGEVPDDPDATIDALPKDSKMAFLHELLKLQYRGCFARREVAQDMCAQFSGHILWQYRKVLGKGFGARTVQYCEALVQADHQRFGELLQDIGAADGDTVAKLDALPRRERFVLFFSIIDLRRFQPEDTTQDEKLEYLIRLRRAKRIVEAEKHGKLQDLLKKVERSQPGRSSIEDLRDEVIGEDREELETTLKVILGDPSDHLRERLSLLTENEGAALWSRLLTCRYNHKKKKEPPAAETGASGGGSAATPGD